MDAAWDESDGDAGAGNNGSDGSSSDDGGDGDGPQDREGGARGGVESDAMASVVQSAGW